MTGAEFIAAGSLASRAIAPGASAYRSWRDKRDREAFWVQIVHGKKIPGTATNRSLTKAGRMTKEPVDLRARVAKDIDDLLLDPSELVAAPEVTALKLDAARAILKNGPRPEMARDLDGVEDLGSALGRLRLREGGPGLTADAAGPLARAIGTLGGWKERAPYESPPPDPKGELGALLAMKAWVETAQESEPWIFVLKAWSRQSRPAGTDPEQDWTELCAAWGRTMADLFLDRSDLVQNLSDVRAMFGADARSSAEWRQQALEMERTRAAIRSSHALRVIAICFAAFFGAVATGATLDAFDVFDFSDLVKNLVDDEAGFFELPHGG